MSCTLDSDRDRSEIDLNKVVLAFNFMQAQSNIFCAQSFQWTVNPEQNAKVRFEKGKNLTSADVNDQAVARNYVFAQ